VRAPPAGVLDGHLVTGTVAALMPELVIVIDESTTPGGLVQASAGALAHHRLTATGAAISYAIAAVGAAITAPERLVLCPRPDSSPRDTMSGLCTPARGNLDAITLIEQQRCRRPRAHRAQRLGAASAPGPTAPDLVDLSRPTPGFVTSPRT
jgi:hypothetical protein